MNFCFWHCSLAKLKSTGDLETVRFPKSWNFTLKGAVASLETSFHNQSHSVCFGTDCLFEDTLRATNAKTKLNGVLKRQHSRFLVGIEWGLQLRKLLKSFAQSKFPAAATASQLRPRQSHGWRPAAPPWNKAQRTNQVFPNYSISNSEVTLGFGPEAPCFPTRQKAQTLWGPFLQTNWTLCRSYSEKKTTLSVQMSVFSLHSLQLYCVLEPTNNRREKKS